MSSLTEDVIHQWVIVDATGSQGSQDIPPLPESFGRSLDTIDKARQWLTNPNNWFESTLFILKWDGLLPKISSRHGRRLIAEPWDNGLPWVVVTEQKQRRSKNDRGESIDEAPERELLDCEK